MPKTYYAGIDFGTGVRGINSPDPVNPQDAANRHYVVTHGLLAGTPPGGSYWESLVQSASASNSYTGGWANGPGLPPTSTITKLYASTRIRCKIFNVSSWATSVGGWVAWGVSVNGGAIWTITRFFHNRLGTRASAPFGLYDFVPSLYPQVNGTGPMQVVWYVMTSAGCIWTIDSLDCPLGPGGLISEMP